MKKEEFDEAEEEAEVEREEEEQEEGGDEEQEEVHPQNSFRLAADKVLNWEIKLLEWCPRMDLLALVTVEDQLLVHRLSWQRLFAIPSDKRVVTALTWRPDGKVIAVGYQDGTITLFDIESSEAFFTSHFHSSAITALSWTHYHQRQPASSSFSASSPFSSSDYAELKSSFLDYRRDREQMFLLPLAPSPLAEAAASSRSTSSVAKEVRHVANHESFLHAAELSVLVSGDSSGVVLLSAQGTFCVGRASFELSQKGDNNVEIIRLCLDPSLQHLNVVTRTTTPRLPEEIVFSLHEMDTGLLWRHPTDVQQMTVRLFHVSAHISHLVDSIQSIHSQWKSGTKDFFSRMNEFAGLMEEDGRDPTMLRNDLLSLMLSGVPSPSLERFLVKNMTEQGVRRLWRHIEVTCEDVQDLAVKHLHKVGEALLFQLSELQALSQWLERFGLLGLEESTLSDMVSLAAAFLLKTKEFLRVLLSVKKGYQHFFNWLYLNACKICDTLTKRKKMDIKPVDINKVSSFIQHELLRDDISPFFLDEAARKEQQQLKQEQKEREREAKAAKVRNQQSNIFDIFERDENEDIFAIGSSSSPSQPQHQKEGNHDGAFLLLQQDDNEMNHPYFQEWESPHLPFPSSNSSSLSNAKTLLELCQALNELCTIESKRPANSISKSFKHTLSTNLLLSNNDEGYEDGKMITASTVLEDAETGTRTILLAFSHCFSSPSPAIFLLRKKVYSPKEEQAEEKEGWQATKLDLEEVVSISHIAFYKDERLAALLGRKQQQQSEEEPEEETKLEMFNFEESEWKNMDELQSEEAFLSLFAALERTDGTSAFVSPSQGRTQPRPLLRSSSSSSSSETRHYKAAVSDSRGLAAVFIAPHRVLLYDLEDEEDSDDEDDDENENEEPNEDDEENQNEEENEDDQGEEEH
ncbi:anaphase promoting complex subunit 4 [Balamuthia mandrillaris]